MKAHNKQAKAERFARAKAGTKLEWVHHTEWHWSHKTRFGADIEYWPSTGVMIDRGTGIRRDRWEIEDVEKYVVRMQ